MAGPMVRLATYINSIEAELARNQLEAAGIPAFLSGERSGSLFAGVGSALAQIELYVSEDHVADAQAVLERLDQEEETEDTVQEDIDPQTGIIESGSERWAETEETARTGPAIRSGLPPLEVPTRRRRPSPKRRMRTPMRRRIPPLPGRPSVWLPGPCGRP
jgi:hypothetical protein